MEKSIQSLDQLKVGSIIRHKSGGPGYVVTGNYGPHVTAVCSKDISNPSEWVQIVPNVPPSEDKKFEGNYCHPH